MPTHFSRWPTPSSSRNTNVESCQPMKSLRKGGRRVG
jgi:hypothetical protein